MKEASWIQEGLDGIDKKKFSDIHPYHNALGLEDAKFFHGYG